MAPRVNAILWTHASDPPYSISKNFISQRKTQKPMKYPTRMPASSGTTSCVGDDQGIAPVFETPQVHHDPRYVIKLLCQGDQEVRIPEQGSPLDIPLLQHLQSLRQDPCLVVRHH